MIIHSHRGRWLKTVKELLVRVMVRICAVCGVNPCSDERASFGRILVNDLHLVKLPTSLPRARLDRGLSDAAKRRGPGGNKEPLHLASGAAEENPSSHDHEAQWKQEKKGWYLLIHGFLVGGANM